MDMTPFKLEQVLSPHQRAEVSILLAERHENMRQLLVSALIAQRLSQVSTTGHLEGVIDSLEKGEPDILVLDGGLPGRDTTPFDLVRDIRRGRVGSNPFIAIFLTLWQPDRETIRLASECGADAILVKPLAPADLVERIAALAASKKRYVAAGEYVGPDRRNPRGRNFTTPPVDVPNTLSMKAQGTFDSRHLAESLADAEDAMRNLWLRRQSLRLAALARILEEDPCDTIVAIFDQVSDDLAQGLTALADAPGGSEIQLADTLAQVTKAVVTRKAQARLRAIDLLPPVMEALLLLVMPESPRVKLEAEIDYLSQAEAARFVARNPKFAARRKARQLIDSAFASL
jgi:DNA-binding response OmpR family regulator